MHFQPNYRFVGLAHMAKVTNGDYCVAAGVLGYETEIKSITLFAIRGLIKY